MTDVIMQRYMPKNILESNDEHDDWSFSRRSSSTSGSSNSSSPTYFPHQALKEPDFRLFEDYFGLSNLLNNMKFSDDNPLLLRTQRNLLQRGRKVSSSWESDGSDSSVVTSPRIENSNFDMNNNFTHPILDAKSIPPPSMRLSKEERDLIISGVYKQQLEMSNRHPAELKILPPVHNQPPATSPIMPPSPPKQNLPPAPPQQHASTNNNENNSPRTQSSVCVFCRNNGETENVYTSHVLKDIEGRTSCPILRAYTCPICKANGDNSHTIKYCPMNQNSRSNSFAGSVPPPHSVPTPMMNMPPLLPQQHRNSFPQPIRGNFRPPFNFPPLPRCHPGKIR